MNRRIGLILINFAAVVLAGCSYLQSFFPDKERDYQYTTEIPMINYPTELRQNQSVNDSISVDSAGASPATSNASNIEGNDTSAVSSDQPPASDITSGSESTPTTEPSPTEVTPVNESDGRDAITSVEIVKYDDGESRLRLGAGHSKSWRAVNKALSRNMIEIIKRDHDQSQITVEYDPDEKKAKDEGFMDEIWFIFKGINMNEQEYALKLEEHDQQTDVIVLDEEHLPLLNNNAALRLLKLMADTIKADLAKKEKAEKEQQETETPADAP